MIEQKRLEEINNLFISEIFKSYKTILQKVFGKAEQINTLSEYDFRNLILSVVTENSNLVVEAFIPEAKTIKDAIKNNLKDEDEDEEKVAERDDEEEDDKKTDTSEQSEDEEENDKNATKDKMPPKKKNSEGEVEEQAATTSGEIATGDFRLGADITNAIREKEQEERIKNIPTDIFSRLQQIANESGKGIDTLVELLFDGMSIGDIEESIEDEKLGLDNPFSNKDDLVNQVEAFWTKPENKKWLNEALSRKL